MEEIIKEYFKKFDFDIRKTHDGRYMDQKVTPDVLTVIAEAVNQYIFLNKEKELFTVKDIWELDYLNTTVITLFGKPSMLNETAQSEYDKFVQQPLKMLAAAKILDCQKLGNKNYFKILNNEILEYISLKERNALNFITLYLEKVLQDSELLKDFNYFFENPTKTNYFDLKQKYINFIKLNTNIKKDLEPKRIFTKVINPLAFKKSSYGSEKGYLSKNIIKYTDLMYNRINFRDLKKEVNETRAEFKQSCENSNIINYSPEYKNYIVQKAKRLIKKIHGDISEVNDELAVGKATQVHHIFPINEFPEIGAYLENLILLTASQHYTKAHENNYTIYINKQYQYICLLAKLNTVKSFVLKNDFRYYSKENYIYVISVGTGETLSNKMTFDEIENYLFKKYNAS